MLDKFALTVDYNRENKKLTLFLRYHLAFLPLCDNLQENVTSSTLPCLMVLSTGSSIHSNFSYICIKILFSLDHKELLKVWLHYQQSRGKINDDIVKFSYFVIWWQNSQPIFLYSTLMQKIAGRKRPALVDPVHNLYREDIWYWVGS